MTLTIAPTARDRIVAILTGTPTPTSGEEYAQLVDRILDVIDPPTCPHLQAENAANGYICCQDCGDWLGVWRVMP